VKFQMKWIAKIALVMIAAASLLPATYARAQKRAPAAVSAVNSSSADEAFLALRDAARNDDAARAAQIAAQLGNYAIPSYVDYYRLKPRLREVSAQEVRDFLARYDGSAIGDRLRNDWLLELGRARDWATFDEQYPLFVLNDDTQLKCFALVSKAQKGYNVADDARALLVSPKDYGDGCIVLISTLAQNGQFNADDVWAQIRLAAESNYAGIARRIGAVIDVQEGALLQAIERPEQVLDRRARGFRKTHELFIVALGRSAKNSLAPAISALDLAISLTPKQRALAWAQIALQASLKLAPEAIDYWRKAGDAPLSQEGHQWKVRSALREGDWKLVKAGVEAMPPALRSDPAWVYWLGRALKAEGNAAEAQAHFHTIASQTNFYGQLALEELGEKITIPPRALALTAEEIAPMAENQGFRRALKFFDLNLRFEGYREWNWELRRMNERQHLAAAEFARQSNVLDRMVNTSDRTRAEFDFTQRFPAPHNDIMQPTTQTLGLDRAWVYGVIRQESRFIMNARSHVGASGLMQLMPATARYVARKIGMDGFTQNQVNDITTNILLGTHYLSMVLNDLDGSQALATAAYNAGPGRPRAWRSTLTRAVEGAIFAESIPFNETRGYVKNVLSNATYYAALFESKPQSLKARLGMVAPRGFVPSELP
jgi:soluble lytic murein transglycosylase